MTMSMTEFEAMRGGTRKGLTVWLRGLPLNEPTAVPGELVSGLKSPTAGIHSTASQNGMKVMVRTKDGITMVAVKERMDRPTRGTA